MRCVAFASRVLAGLLVLVQLALPVAPVSAQTSPPPAAAADNALQREYRAAFDAMLADPANLDKTFKFAQLAIQVGDLEGAVGALERMLVVNPNLPRVRLELGVLYARLGSYEQARAYLQEALKAPELPPTVRRRAELVLLDIDKARSPSRWSGSVMAGLRYQSNANAAPGGGTVRVGGIDSQLGPSGTAQKDWNVFAVTSLMHLYDLGTQDGDVIDSRAILYAARQFEASEVNLLYGGFSSGPRMKLLPGSIEGATIRPAVAVDYVMLDDRTEYFAPGASLGFEYGVAGGVVTLGFDYRYRDYHDSSEKPFNSNRSGHDLGVRLAVDKQVTPWLIANAGASLSALDARRGFESYREWAVWIGLTFLIDGASLVEGQRGVLSINVARVDARYRTPDPTIDPDERRHDRDWRLSATLAVPVWEQWSLILQGGVTDRNSSLPNYAYTNWFGTLGVSMRF